MEDLHLLNLHTFIFIFGILLQLPCCCSSEQLRAAHDVQARQVWPGEVQVVWRSGDTKQQDFTVYYTEAAMMPLDRWHQQAGAKGNLVTISGLRAHTNYSVIVVSHKGSESVTSNTTYVYVREGVPWPPYNLTLAFVNSSTPYFLIKWKSHNQHDHNKIEGHRVVVNRGNETFETKTHYETYRLQTQGSILDYFTAKVYAYNKVGESSPAVVEYRTFKPNKRRGFETPVGPLPQPHSSNNIVVYIVGGIAGVLLVIILIGALVIFRRRRNRNEAPLSDEMASYQPFIRGRGGCDSHDSDFHLQQYAHQYPPDRPVYLHASPHEQPPYTTHQDALQQQQYIHDPFPDATYNFSSNYRRSRPISGVPPPPPPVPDRSANTMDIFRYSSHDSICGVGSGRNSPIYRGGGRPSPISKRVPIIPIDLPDDRIYANANVDVTKYQLNGSRTPSRYSTHEYEDPDALTTFARPQRN